MGLKEEITKIVQLQEIDSKIHSLTRQKDVEKPAQLENIKNECERNQQALAAFEDRIKNIQLKKKESELELASKEGNLSKAQGHLYQLKTNKEYQAKLAEIGSLKADISLDEEIVIKVLDEVEAAKKELDKEKELVKAKERELKEEEGKLTSQIKDIEAEIVNLQDKRKVLIVDVDSDILSKYEQLLKKRQGLAIVPVKANNCGACHMMVTHQKINEIKMYADLVLCENCVRVLYMLEDISQ